MFVSINTIFYLTSGFFSCMHSFRFSSDWIMLWCRYSVWIENCMGSKSQTYIGYQYIKQIKSIAMCKQFQHDCQMLRALIVLNHMWSFINSWDNVVCYCKFCMDSVSKSKTNLIGTITVCLNTWMLHYHLYL